MSSLSRSLNFLSLADSAEFWGFLVVVLILGGAAAFVSGKAIAETWRPLWQLPVYMALLAAGVRFVQFSVFGSTLLSAKGFAIDYVIVLVAASLGYVLARRSQMATQYGWIGPSDRT